MAKPAWTANHDVRPHEPADYGGPERVADGSVAWPAQPRGRTAGDTASGPGLLPLRGIFDIKRKHYDVVLERDRISWSLIHPTTLDGKRRSSAHEAVSVRDVYAVTVKRVRKPGKNQGYPKGVTLHLAVPDRRQASRLVEERVTLRSSNEDNCQRWRAAIEAVLKGSGNRPRRLRVFVNDWVNNGEATRVFYSKVVPVFQVAGIRLDVIVITREGSAFQILQTLDFDGYDGLVCVGGEDMTREVVHGLLERTQLDADVIEITPETELTPCPVPLGIVPVGMFNLVAYSSQGCSDPFTAVVHIIQGHRQPLDVSAIFHERAFIRFGFSLMYGFGGECLRRAGRRTQGGALGARAAEYAVAKTIFKVRTYRCVVEYLPCEDAIGDGTPCRQGCIRCGAEQPSDGRIGGEESEEAERRGDGYRPVGSCYDNDTGHDRNHSEDYDSPSLRPGEETNGKHPDWVTVTGDFVSVGAMTLPNLCRWCPHGLSPRTHLADGCLDLVLVRGTTRGEFVQHLRRHASAKDQLDFPFVSVHRAKAVRVHPVDAADKPSTGLVSESMSLSLSEGETACSEDGPSSQTAAAEGAAAGPAHDRDPAPGRDFSVWNVDLELMGPVAMEMRVHRQLLTVFAAGIAEGTSQSQPGSCSCL